MNAKGKSKRKRACDNVERVTRSKMVLNDNTMLTEAVVRGDILKVRDILGNKDLKFSSRCLNTALLRAAEEGKKQIVSLLLSHGANVKEDSQTGSLALVAASGCGYLDIVKLLIKKGAPVNGKNSAGKTALMMAVEKSCCSALILYLLRDCEADINLQDNAGKTVLMLAVELWDYETVWTLFMGEESANNCDEDIRDNDGNTALDLAKRNGSAELLSVFSQSCKESLAPLSLAAGRNNLDLVRQLVEIYPSSVETLDYGDSPLPVALHGFDSPDEWDGKIHCSLELMDLLLQAGVSKGDFHCCDLNALMFAAGAGSDKAVQMLLWYGVDLDDQGLNRQTALMMAAEKGHTSIVEKLIEAGADLYIQDLYGNDVLSLAVKGSHKGCAQAVLKHWNNLQARDVELMREHGVLDVLGNVKDRWDQLLENPELLRKVLFIAVKGKCYQLVLALIDFGADMNSWSYITCPLFLALDDSNMLRLLLDCGADVNIRQRSTSNTALMKAVTYSNVNLVRLLLKYNADMYAEANGFTALTLAVKEEKTDVVTELLDGGMDVNHVTQTKQTALLCALMAKNFSLAEMLIKRGADVNFATTDGLTILMQAIKSCTSNFAELIITHGADINSQDDKGETALFHALRHSITRDEKASLLLQHGANVDHINFVMLTPLMVATKYCHANVLRVLLGSQPNVNAQDINGDTALHFAVQFSGYEEKLKVLVSNGADLNIVNVNSENPLMLALKNLDFEVIRSLLSLGVVVDFQTSRSVSQSWKNTLDSIFRRCTDYMGEEFIKCVEVLLEAGCSLHAAQTSNLDKFLCLCIKGDKRKTIQLLLQSGLGPNPLDLSCVVDRLPVNIIIEAASFSSYTVTPLCMAILFGRPQLVTFFAQACFYHQGDIQMLQHPRIRAMLEDLFVDWPDKDSSPLDEMCPKSWSLRTWSKLAVLRAVGFGDSREQRVRALPLPRALKDELLYKNISVL